MSRKILIILFWAGLGLILFGFVGQNKKDVSQKNNISTKANSLKKLRNSYHQRCKKRCKVLLMECLGERMSNTRSDMTPLGASKKKISSGNPESYLNCKNKCVERLRSCRCPADDNECMSSCQDNFLSCIDKCGPYPFREPCGKKYLSCVDNCNNMPECFLDSDCGNDFICSAHRCISAPRCTTDESCPRTDDYICYKGRCIAY